MNKNKETDMSKVMTMDFKEDVNEIFTSTIKNSDCLITSGIENVISKFQKTGILTILDENNDLEEKITYFKGKVTSITKGDGGWTENILDDHGRRIFSVQISRVLCCTLGGVNYNEKGYTLKVNKTDYSKGSFYSKESNWYEKQDIEGESTYSKTLFVDLSGDIKIPIT